MLFFGKFIRVFLIPGPFKSIVGIDAVSMKTVATGRKRRIATTASPIVMAASAVNGIIF